MKLNPYTLGLAAGAVGLGLAAVYVWHRGIAGAAKDIGGAAVDAVGGVASGVVGGVSEAVGIPTPSQTTTDPKVARWIIDHYGYWEASKWSGAPALAQAWWMDSGTGTAPAAESELARYLATLPQSTSVDYDETERLRARYPALEPAPASYDPTGYAYGA